MATSTSSGPPSPAPPPGRYTQLAKLSFNARPAAPEPNNFTAIFRRVVVGDFDGLLGDEVAVFSNTGGFAGNGHISFLDLTTLAPPSWWNSTALGPLQNG